MSLEQAFKNAVARVTDERGKPAVLGKSDGTLYWTDPSGMTHRTRVWARIGEQNSNQAVVVDCLKASPQVDLPVRVDYVNGVLTVIGVDDRRAIEFGGGRPGTPVGAHAWLHSRLGPDPLYIEGLQYLPLAVVPNTTPDLTVMVQGGAYLDLSGNLKLFETAVSGSLSSYVPGSGSHFVIICLDRSDGSIAIVDGDDVSAGGDALFPEASVTPADIEAVTISTDYWPLGVVLLSASQTEVKAKDIVNDLRPIGSSGGGSPGGADTQLQYNNSGAFGGTSGLVWDSATGKITHTKNTATALEYFLVLDQDGAGGSYINMISGVVSGRIGMRSTFLDIASTSPINISGGTVGLSASTDINFDPGGYAAVYFRGGATPEAVFNEQADSGYAFRIETGNNEYMVYVDPANDAFQIGGATAGTIADFRSTAIVFNNGEADIDVRIAGNGVTNAVVYDAGTNQFMVGTATPDTAFTNPNMYIRNDSGLPLLIRRDSSGTPSPFTMYNGDTTDNAGLAFAFATDTTGTGAATGQQLAQIRGVFDTHDHATRSASTQFFNVYNGSGAVRAIIAAGMRIGSPSGGDPGAGAMSLDAHLNLDEMSSTPSSPTAGTMCNIYMKADKLVIQYNDGGTVRYKYLSLTGTGVTWQHSTTAP